MRVFGNAHFIVESLSVVDWNWEGQVGKSRIKRFKNRFRRVSYFILLLGISMGAVCEVHANPVEVTSPELKKIRVESDRPMGRLIIYANYSSHRIIVDGAEFPAYLSDSGIEVTSNEIHEVTVISSGGVEKKYRLSVNPSQTLALYVDFGSTKPKDKAGSNKNDKKKEEAAMGFLTITAESEAQVYIDGRLASSKTPLRKHEVNVGSHTVRVYFFDTRKFSKSREVYVGKGVSMSLNFSKD